MATLKDLDQWTEPLNRFGNNIHILAETIYCGTQDEYMRRFCFYTSTNKYTILAIERKPNAERKSYLGCIASCRKPRAGESQHRGSDLADGDLTYETWVNVLSDIVSYEMVGLHITEATPIPDNEEVTGLSLPN